ncbi:MAG: hypothetical protein GX978_01500 [Tissierellia bacterium]|jgi:hypothetical protein|nr:hypothetical protein [Tissierellia bacterium]
MDKTTVVNPAHYNEEFAKKSNQPINEHPELHEMEQTGAYDGLIDEVKSDKDNQKPKE